MDFILNEDQKMLRNTVRRIAEEKFAPIAAEIDEKEIFPSESVKILAENGLLGVQIRRSMAEPVRECCHGFGSGRDRQGLLLYFCYFDDSGAGKRSIASGRNGRAKKNFLYRMASGGCLGACGITEPGAGSDVSGMKTKARKVDGGYVLDGAKIFITNGGEAEIVTVLAYTDQEKGNRGISMLILDKSMPGFTVGKKEHKMGLHGSDTRELVFENIFVPQDRLLGPEGSGFRTLMTTFNYTRPAVGGQALGIAQGALEASIKYAKERVQFGKPLSAFQGMQWMLAEMALSVETARSIVYRAASMIDTEPEAPDLPKIASMAKWYASDVAMKVTTDAVQVFGGYGYVREYPVERMMRDAKITQIYEGTNQIQRTIIAGQILR